MHKENTNQKFRLKNIDKIRNYLIEEINRNELTSKKHKNFRRDLNYIDRSLVVKSTITGCVFHFCFCFFSSYSYRNYKFCYWIENLCNNCRSINKKKEKKHDKIDC